MALLLCCGDNPKLKAAGGAGASLGTKAFTAFSSRPIGRLDTCQHHFISAAVGCAQHPVHSHRSVVAVCAIAYIRRRRRSVERRLRCSFIARKLAYSCAGYSATASHVRRSSAGGLEGKCQSAKEGGGVVAQVQLLTCAGDVIDLIWSDGRLANLDASSFVGCFCRLSKLIGKGTFDLTQDHVAALAASSARITSEVSQGQVDAWTLASVLRAAARMLATLSSRPGHLKRREVAARGCRVLAANLQGFISSCIGATPASISNARPQDLASLARALARLGELPQAVDSDAVQAAMQAVASKADVVIDSLTLQDVSDLAWAIAKLEALGNVDDSMVALLPSLATRTTALIDQGSRVPTEAQHLAKIAWAFAASRANNVLLFEAIAKECVKKQSEFTTQEVSNLAWSFATLNILNPQLTRMVEDELLVNTAHWSPQSLANVVWSLARLHCSSERVFHQIARHSVLRMDSFLPQHIANSAWAFAKANVHNDSLFLLIDDQVDSKLTSFKTQELASLAWSYATLGRGTCKALEGLIFAAGSTPAALRPQELSNVAWACATTRVGVPWFLSKMAVQARSKLEKFKTQEMANLLWALAVSPCDGATTAVASVSPLASRADDPRRAFPAVGADWLRSRPVRMLVYALVRRVIRAAVSGAMEARDIANVAWAFAKLSAAAEAEAEPGGDPITLAHHNNELFVALANAARSKLGAFQQQDLSNMLWALATSGADHDISVVRDLSLAVAARAASFSARHLASIAWALATLGLGAPSIAPGFAAAADAGEAQEAVVAGEVAFREVAAHAKARLADFSLQGLSNVMWAMASSGTPAKGFFQLAEKRVLNEIRVLEEMSRCSANGIPAQPSPIAATADGRARTIGVQSQGACGAAASAADERFAVKSDHIPSPRGFVELPWRLAEAARHLTGALWALNVVGAFGERVADAEEQPLVTVAASQALRAAGRVIDACDGTGCIRDEHEQGILRLDPDPKGMAGDGDAGKPDYGGGGDGVGLVNEEERGEPRVMLQLEDRLVVQKPPGWEVDDSAAMGGAGSTRRRPNAGRAGLSNFVEALVSSRQRPILRDAQHQLGFVHRLDVPSSGLVLTALTYEAFFDLRLQLVLDQISRDYVIVCHGWTPTTGTGTMLEFSLRWTPEVDGAAVSMSADGDAENTLVDGRHCRLLD